MDFPVTKILDSFTRADSTSTMGTDWTALKLYAGTGTNLGISSNRAYNPAAQFARYLAMYYNPAIYGPDCEVYFTITVRSSTSDTDCPGLYARVTNPGSTFNGYVFGANYSANTVQIERIDAGVTTVLGAAVSQTLSSGDKMGFRLNGSTLEGWIYRAGSWSLVISRTDSTYNTAGYFGIYIPNNHQDDRLDDFGGGKLPKFIEKNGTKLNWNGKEFRFVGGNNYPLIKNKWSRSDTALFFSYMRQANLKMLRTWCFLEDFTRIRYTPGTNLITNTSFETNTTGWVNTDNDFTRSSDDAYDGTYSMKQVSAGGYEGFGIENITVSASTEYVLTYWAKVTRTSGFEPVIFIQVDNFSGATILDGGYVSDTNGVWEEKQVLFTTGVGQTNIAFRIFNFSGTVNAFYDNFNLSLKGSAAIAGRESMLAQIDIAVEEAANNGVKLMLCLVDNTSNYNSKLTHVQRTNTIYAGGLSTTYPYVAFWNDSNCRTLYKDCMDILLNHTNIFTGLLLKNSDAIGIIELINEGRYDVFDSEGGHQNAATSATNSAGNIYKVHAWITDVGGHFQTEDTNHLLNFGSAAHAWEWVEGDTVFNGSGYGVDYRLTPALSVLDLGDFHTYPTQGGDGTQLLKYGQKLGYPNSISGAGYDAQLTDFVTQINAAGKPAICGEVGFDRGVIGSNTYYPLYPRVNSFKRIGDTLFAAGLSGIFPWDLAMSGSGLTYGINISNTWDGTTTNDNYDDRPIVTLFKVWAAGFMGLPFPKFHKYGIRI